MKEPAPLPAETESTTPERVVPQHLERLAWAMDQAIRIPGTQIRLGADSLLGLIPGIGDIIGLIISAWVVVSSVQAGARQHTVVRMLGNITKDAVLGSVPVIGDLFDVASRANSKNIELLRDDLEAQKNQSARAKFLAKFKLWALISGVVTLLGLAIYGAVELLRNLL